MLLKVSDQRILHVGGGAKMPSYRASKPKIMGTTKLACGWCLPKYFRKSGFELMTSHPCF